MERQWRLENSDNEYKFFLNDKLVIHVYRSEGVWYGYVLGSEEVIRHKHLSYVLTNAEIEATACGWIEK